MHICYSFSSKKKLIGLITIFCIALALILTLLLAQKPQDLRQQASTNQDDTPKIVSILVLNYLPTKDHISLDSTTTKVSASLQELSAWIHQQNAQSITALTASTKYHGYKNSQAIPAITYTLLEQKTFYKAVPTTRLPILGTDADNWSHYNEMLTTDVSICDYVDNRNVQEVWIWSYQTETTKIHESNMSMGRVSQPYWNRGTYGNISNSQQIDDLPQCDKTYTVYNFNYHVFPELGWGNMLHVYGHQMEAVMRWLDHSLWEQFTYPVGYAQGKNRINHCGTIHSPPNSVNRTLTELQPKLQSWDISQCADSPTTACEGMQNYSVSVVPVPSDCEDWRPEGIGTVQMIDCRNWYRQSDGKCPAFQSAGEAGGAYYYMWWRQNIPGLNNNLPYQGNVLRSWWDFFADFDQALLKGKTLIKIQQPLSPSPTPQTVVTPTILIPTATPTHIPTPTYSPTPSPSRIPTPTMTPIQTPTATPTQIPERTYIKITIGFPNHARRQQNVPVPATKQATVELYTTNNTKITERIVTLKPTTAHTYEGTIDLEQQFETGTYRIKIRSSKYLNKNIHGLQTITANKTNNMPILDLVAGDITGDNVIDLTDFNIWLACFGKTMQDTISNVSCAHTDLNEDDHVDSTIVKFDYLVLLDAFRSIKGD